MPWMIGMMNLVRTGRALGGRAMENEYMIVDIKGKYQREINARYTQNCC